MAKKSTEIQKAEEPKTDIQAGESWPDIILNLLNNNLVSKGVSKLIDTVDTQFGLFMKPYHEDRMNKTKAKAPIYKLETKFKLEDMEAEQIIKRMDRDDRIKERVFERESRRQKNLESIAVQAAQLMPPDVEDRIVDEDWTASFVESCQDVGDEEMQSLWARILAGEVAKPGRYSTRTLNCVRSMSKQEAELFTKFCSCLWKLTPLSNDDLFPIVPEPNSYMNMDGMNIGYDELQVLDSVGLIRVDSIGHSMDFTFRPMIHGNPVVNCNLEFDHFGKRYRFLYRVEAHSLKVVDHSAVGNELKQSLDFGKAMLTPVGQQLALIARPVENSAVRQFCLDFFESKGWRLDVDLATMTTTTTT